MLTPKGCHDRIASLLIHCFNTGKKLFHVRTMRVRFVWTQLYLLFISLIQCKLPQVAFSLKAQRPDNSQRHFLHLQADRHSGKTTLEK